MIIKGGTIFQENRTFAKKDIYVENGRIIAISEPEDLDVSNYQSDSEQIIDATGLYVLPGLIDIHSHGAVGHDFSDGDLKGLQEILAYQCAHGVTSYCPTSMTLPKERLLEIYEAVGNWSNLENGKSESTMVTNSKEKSMANVPGFHMEGPFIDPLKKGAHREKDIIAPDVDFFRKCNEACGNRIKIVTVAPDGVGALEFIREIQSGNKDTDSKDEHFSTGKIIVSLGHTSADYDTAKAAFSAGVTHITHLFNAMPPMNHRNPGLICAAAEEENCYAELICDGVHVHESMVRAAFKLFPGRIVLISDSMRAMGLGDGTYDLGGQQVYVTGNLAKLKDGTIAGSVTHLFDCLKKAISFGIAPGEAIAAATMNPAKSIGVYDTIGSLSVGKHADIILVDKEFNLVKTMKSFSSKQGNL